MIEALYDNTQTNVCFWNWVLITPIMFGVFKFSVLDLTYK